MNEEGYWDFTDEITSKDLAIDSLIKQLQAYKDKQDKLKSIMQNEIDNLQINCDVFNEQMNNAVERTVELNNKLDKIKEYCKAQKRVANTFIKSDKDFIYNDTMGEDILKIIEGE